MTAKHQQHNLSLHLELPIFQPTSKAKLECYLQRTSKEIRAVSIKYTVSRKRVSCTSQEPESTSKLQSRESQAQS